MATFNFMIIKTSLEPPRQLVLLAGPCSIRDLTLRHEAIPQNCARRRWIGLS
jgi:hypothetical protein